MRPAVMYPDAQATVAGYLRGLLAGRGEPYVTGVEVATRVPSGRSADFPRLPYVMVRQDGPGTAYSYAVARVPIRVSVWHHTEDDAHDLAQIACGLLNAHGQMTAGTPPALDTDPDTGDPVAYFTAAVVLRSQPIPAI